MGRTANFRRQRSDNPVHPHPRGENVLFATATLFWNGTPPPAWGEHFRISPMSHFPITSPAWGEPAHPDSEPEPSGTPPAWENPSRRLQIQPFKTPTRVGTTRWPTRSPSRRYPHRVGTTAQSCRGHGQRWYPPPAWGELCQGGRGQHPLDTPTRVGRTPHGESTALCGKVHPHPRGENTSLSWAFSVATPIKPFSWPAGLPCLGYHQH